MVCHELFVRIEYDCTKLPILEWHALFVWPIHVLPPTRKKVAFVFFVVESLSNPGNVRKNWLKNFPRFGIILKIYQKIMYKIERRGGAGASGDPKIVP